MAGDGGWTGCGGVGHFSVEGVRSDSEEWNMRLMKTFGLCCVFFALGCSEDEPTFSQPQIFVIPQNTNFEVCASQGFEAFEDELDVVIAAENSNLALDFAERVQSNLDGFAQTFAARRVRAVYLSFRDYPAKYPVTDPSREILVDTFIDEGLGLFRLRNDFERYGVFLRDDAPVHFISITATDSDVERESFRNEMRELLGRDFTFHAVASPEQSCVDSKEPGVEYLTLAAEQGGTTASVCDPDWSNIADAVASSVQDPVPLPCLIAPPEPPEGDTLDGRRAAVLYTNGNGEQFELPRFEDASECVEDSDGWFFANSIGQGTIQLCPDTCGKVSADFGGVLGAAYACSPTAI